MTRADPQQLPATYQFSSANSLGNIVAWEWDFGDGGSPSFDSNPTHTYNSDGPFTVNLTVSSKVDSDSATTRVIPGTPGLVADFNATPTSGNANLTVKFSDLSVGNPTSWEWDFGDGGSPSFDPNPTHPYCDAGIFTVSLTVSDGTYTNTQTREDYITVYPTAKFEMYGAAQFVDKSLGNPDSWTWEFGDGVSSSEKNPTHLYPALGNYLVNLTVSRTVVSTVLKNTTSKMISLTELPPVADFTGSPLIGQRPLTVQFTDLSTNNPASWYWDFGDGKNSTMKNPSHIYIDPGTYAVSLTASNSGGSSVPILKENYITVTGPKADFIASPRSGPKPLTVYFTDLSTGNPTEWAWDFNNDGVTDSHEQNSIWQYDTNGIYTVKLTVDYTKPWSDSEPKTSYITVSQVPSPEADFSASPRSGTKPLTVYFTDLSTGNPTEWAWDFNNDGVIESHDQNPKYPYTVPGMYTVSLNATNEGGSNTNTKSGYIVVDEVPGPVADFTASPRSGTRPLTVDFSDLSSGNPIGWAWDFTNDGTIDSYDSTRPGLTTPLGLTLSSSR